MISWLKDARPVSFRSELFTSYILTYLSSETYSRNYEKLPNIVVHACKMLQKNVFVKMSGPQIWLCLFTFRPIASKQLNGLTTVDILSWLGGAVVTHPLWLHEVPGSIPGSGKGFLCLIFCFVIVVFLLFCPKTHYLSRKFAILVTILFYLGYLTYCKICGRL